MFFESSCSRSFPHHGPYLSPAAHPRDSCLNSDISEMITDCQSEKAKPIPWSRNLRTNTDIRFQDAQGHVPPDIISVRYAFYVTLVQTLKNSAAIRVEMHSILRPAWNTHQVIPLWLDIQRIGSDRVRAGVQHAPPRRPAITRLFSRVETHLADRATRERQGMTKPASIQQRIRRRLTR